MNQSVNTTPVKKQKTIPRRQRQQHQLRQQQQQQQQQRLHTETKQMNKMSEPVTTTTSWSTPAHSDTVSRPVTEQLEEEEVEYSNYTPDPILVRKCGMEKGRLLCERTFPLTRCGSKYVAIGVDPVRYNEPTLCIRGTNNRGVIFYIPEFEEILSKLPQILEAITEVMREGQYKVLAESTSHQVMLLPHKVVKFQHVSVLSSICLAEETLRVFVHLGGHFLALLVELREKWRVIPRMDLFAAAMAERVVKDSEGALNDECAHRVIRDTFMNSYNAYELYYKFYHHVHYEAARIVWHIKTFNNFNYL